MTGSQTPSERIAPRRKSTDGPDAAKLLRVGGLTLDPWQELVISDWMGRTAAGRWAAPTCGGSVPRQNGKSLLVQGRAIAGMLLYNEQVIYTAHLQKTATETFEEMRDFFEGQKIKQHVAEIKTALGREQIILRNGARIKFIARTRNGGRGIHGDLLIFDEAQEIDANQQASFLPAISASLNPQVIYVGTPPGPESPGGVFGAIRQRAINKETSRTAWFEFSVSDIGNVHDKKRWAETNPALGRRILLSTVEGEAEQMDPITFARERLGWWTPPREDKIETALDLKAWAACASDDKKPDGKTAYGVKFTADGAEVVLCGAVCPESGPARVAMIERRATGEGVRWLAEWLNDRYQKACCVVIDGRNGVDVLIDKISGTWRMRGSVIRPGARDMLAAVSLLSNEINERSVTWYRPQEDLNESATTSTKRPLSGGWAFGGENPAPIEACALALWGCRTSKRAPGKEMKIG